jgi:hypothetical protein
MSVADHVLKFVAKSGGIEKIRSARKALGGMPKPSVPGYMRSVSQDDDAACQMFAAALLGFVIAELVYDEAKRLSEAS